MAAGPGRRRKTATVRHRLENGTEVEGRGIDTIEEMLMAVTNIICSQVFLNLVCSFLVSDEITLFLAAPGSETVISSHFFFARAIFPPPPHPTPQPTGVTRAGRAHICSAVLVAQGDTAPRLRLQRRLCVCGHRRLKVFGSRRTIVMCHKLVKQIKHNSSYPSFNDDDIDNAVTRQWDGWRRHWWLFLFTIVRTKYGCGLRACLG